MYDTKILGLPAEDMELTCYRFVLGEATPLALEETAGKIVFSASELTAKEKKQFINFGFGGLIGVRGDEIFVHGKAFRSGHPVVSLDSKKYEVSLIGDNFKNDTRYYAAGLIAV